MIHHYGILCYDIEETAFLYTIKGAKSFLTVKCEGIRKTLHYMIDGDKLIELIQDWDYDGEIFTSKLDHIGIEINDDFDDYTDVVYIPELGAEVLFIDEYPVVTELLRFESEDYNPANQIPWW